MLELSWAALGIGVEIFCDERRAKRRVGITCGHCFASPPFSPLRTRLGLESGDPERTPPRYLGQNHPPTAELLSFRSCGERSEHKRKGWNEE